jgi:hypothetical protein
MSVTRERQAESGILKQLRDRFCRRGEGLMVAFVVTSRFPGPFVRVLIVLGLYEVPVGLSAFSFRLTDQVSDSPRQ